MVSAAVEIAQLRWQVECADYFRLRGLLMAGAADEVVRHAAREIQLGMNSALLRKNIEPLLGDGLEHVTSIRIGTKALAYWPYRFISDHDADDLLRLFEDVRSSGRQLLAKS